MKTLSVVAAVALLFGVVSVAAGAIVQDGLIVYLDAEAQIQAGGMGRANNVWRNLADRPDSVAGSGTLHNFNFDGSSGWVGAGVPGNPYALRFDGQSSYVLGPGNIELAEVTLEAWAWVEGHTLRAATLIGNDFGQGGISLMAQPVSESVMLLNGATFTSVDAETPVREWQQIAVTYKDSMARIFVNGVQQVAVQAPRYPQKDHRAQWQLGAARHPENNFAEADGLIGSLAIVRVYNRALSAAEIKGNFDADRDRVGVNLVGSATGTVSSMPLPEVPGLGAVAPARCVKWDYYKHPVRVSASGAPAAPSAWFPNWPYGVRWAFDGYPTNLSQPYVRNYWRTEAFTPDTPATVVIDYRRPVAVTRFVHYFNTFRTPCAWKDVDIYSSSDKEQWRLQQSFAGLPMDAPQVLGIDVPAPARFYKIVVKSLAAGAPRIESHEIETYYGATIGNVKLSRACIQSEEFTLKVRVVSPDAALPAAPKRRGLISPATIKLVAPERTLENGDVRVVGFSMRPGDKWADCEIKVVPIRAGLIPVKLELHSNGLLIDSRPLMLHVGPKLVFSEVSPSGAITAKPGETITISGTITNAGAETARLVKASWMRRVVSLGNLAPGQSARFKLEAAAGKGYSTGELWASGAGSLQTTIRRGVICGTGKSAPMPGGSKLTAFSGGKPCLIVPVAQGKLAAAVPGGVLAIDVGANGGDPNLKCVIIPDDPRSVTPSWLDLELRLAVANPKIMFRPHIDWYEAAKGPNVPHLTNGHNSATRMLCIETTDGITFSMVPSMDNITWGFNKENEMVVQFQIPLAPNPPGRWKPIYEAPMEFSLRLPVRKGDWWDAYLHVAKDIFKFEQPRQWAMPITQMQMLSARYTLRSEVWSEKWQTVRSHPWFDFFYNFYGTTYTLPTLYSWYLVTDDMVALDKAKKVFDWLLSVQQQDGPTAGAWFSQYGVEGNPPQLVGRDQANNRWVMPHSTATAAKTLLWYWEASGKKNTRAFTAARKGCDWLVKTQRKDGGWPYAFDLEGKPVTDLADAGQIWNTWVLWKMWQYTGESNYKKAALASADFYKKTFMKPHRYMGYWEDVSGMAGKVNRSWEGYEPAIAALVFTDMGDKAAALDSAKDAAVWTWTRVISTRQYETCYGETTEQSLCGPSQAQSPMVGIGAQVLYQETGDPIWSDFAGAMKAVNFACDPDQAYGMVATGGWDDPLTGVIGPPYDNVRPWVTPNISKGDEYGRQVWNEWCTNQFAWLALEWLVREGNIRAPQYVKIDLNTYRGSVLGEPGRVKMPEEKCDVSGLDHIDINWVGYQNDDKYVLLIMNHKENTAVAVRPHEAHLDVYNRPPRILVGSGLVFDEAKVVKKGAQYYVTIPANSTALLMWDRIK